MKINWKMEVLDFLFMRVIAFLLGIFLFTFGSFYLYDDFNRGIMTYGFSKFGVAATGWGIIIFFVVIKKQLKQKRQNANQAFSGKN